MTMWCFICETEPVDASDWYHCAKTGEDICPWCVNDMRNNKDHKKVEKLTAALSIYKDDMFSRSFLENILK